MKRNHVAKAVDALHAIQRTVDILLDNAAEAQREFYHHEFYYLPNYLMPGEQQSPISP